MRVVVDINHPGHVHYFKTFVREMEQRGHVVLITASHKDVAIQLKANKKNEWAPLEGDGDFRSDESISLLKQSDIVVTNPPFSLFREYIRQLVDYDKKFLIIHYHDHHSAIVFVNLLSCQIINNCWILTIWCCN